MKKIKDRILLGVLSAAIPGAFARLTNAFEYRRGWTDELYSQTGSSFILTEKIAKTNSLESKVIGSLVNNTTTSVAGIGISYLLSATGRDNALLKGAGVGAMQWLALWGITGKIGLKVRSKKPMTHFLSFIDHVVSMANTALLVSVLGDDSLFPDKKKKEDERIPLISINKESQVTPDRTSRTKISARQ